MKHKEDKKQGYNPTALADKEHEMDRRRRHEDAEFWRLMGQVVDSTPVEKQRKRDIADILQEIFMLSRTPEGPSQGKEKDRRPGMVEENLVRSLPHMSKQQLDYMKKEYAKKATKIKKEKVDLGKTLSNEDKIILKTYQAINMEQTKRMNQDMAKNQQQSRSGQEMLPLEEKDKKKKKSSNKR